MLRKRIIFSLIYSDGYFNQSRNFRLQKVGNEHWLEMNYKFSKIAHSLDELILIDATKENKNILNFSNILEKIVKNVFLPICAGGGIDKIHDAELLFKSGADKIIINTAIKKKPELIKNLVKIYGTQSIVASVDYKLHNNKPVIYLQNGTLKIEDNLNDYLDYLQNLGVGEIYLNSIDRDGTGFGYDLDIIKYVSNFIKIPLIIAGGAGNEKHFIEALKLNEVNAVATANLFNFIGDGLPNARKNILNQKINIANWNFLK
jgi:cyclase